MFRKTTVAALGLMLVAIPGGREIQAQNTMEWSNRMIQGQILEVKGIVGEIHAVLASGDEAEVVARKRGSRGDFEDVAIEVEQVDDGFIICAVYGTWNHGEGHCLPNRRDRDEDHRGRHRNNSIDVEVEFEVRVPAGVEFQGHMVSGDIEVEDLRSEVEVNTDTGAIRVIKIVAAHDIGRVLNRRMLENQFHGGIMQGIGFALMESRRIDARTGKVLTTHIHNYKLPTILDVPDIEVIIVSDSDTLISDVGSKGIGEPAIIPTAGAIANAVYNATGARVKDLPMTPDRVLNVIHG